MLDVKYEGFHLAFQYYISMYVSALIIYAVCIDNILSRWIISFRFIFSWSGLLVDVTQ